MSNLKPQIRNDNCLHLLALADVTSEVSPSVTTERLTLFFVYNWIFILVFFFWNTVSHFSVNSRYLFAKCVSKTLKVLIFLRMFQKPRSPWRPIHSNRNTVDQSGLTAVCSHMFTVIFTFTVIFICMRLFLWPTLKSRNPLCI